MRIVSHQEFMRLPVGTVFAEYESLGCYGNISVKGESCRAPAGDGRDFNDFWYADLTGIESTGSDDWNEKLLSAEENSALSLTPDFSSEARQGGYDWEQRYLVYESADVDALIFRLQQTLHRATPPA